MKEENWQKKIAVVGALNVDIGGMTEGAYVPGDSIPGRVGVSLGGVGWNIARNCASLGAATAFYSVLGRDGHEAAIRRNAEDFGVDISRCLWAPEGNNCYLYIGGADGDMIAAVNDMRLCARVDEPFVRELLPQLMTADVVAADANLPAQTLTALAESIDRPLVCDCVSAAKCGRLRGSLEHIHMLKANRLEAETLTGRTRPEECVRALLDAGVKRVVISLGAEGVLCGEEGALYRCAPSVSRVVDTTGAGDSLTAALAVGTAYGLGLEACAELGVKAAGVTMAQPGAVTRKLTELAEVFL